MIQKDDIHKFLLSSSLRNLRKITEKEILEAVQDLFGRTLEEKIFCLKHKIGELPKCNHCGKQITSMPHSTRGYSKFCSKFCSSRNSASSNLLKRSTTMQERYGAATTLQSAVLHKKVKETTLQKYGVENIGSSAKVREKINKTNLKKYGGSSPCASSSIATLAGKTKKLKAITRHIKAINEFGFNLQPTPTSIFDPTNSICHKCKHSEPFTLATIQRYPICPVCDPTVGSSAAEREIADFIKSLGFKVSYRQKVNGVEADIIILGTNIAVEHHGLYWHSSALGNKASKHASKREHFEQAGFKLIQIFEDEWLLKKDIVMSVLRSKLGKSSRVFARNLEYRNVPKEEASEFIQRTHLAGKTKFKCAYGLYDGNTLVACLTVGADRFKTGHQEILRFCTELNTTVVGGLSKLISKIPGTLFSYCDLRFGDGGGYLKAGFKSLGDTKPGYWYFKSSRTGRIHRSLLQKRKLKSLAENLNLDSSGTEAELATKLKYNRIFDAGHRRFILERNI